MNITEALQSIKTSEKVKKLLQDDTHFLSHACLIEQKDKPSSWEFGFYNKATSKITVFESAPFNERQEDEVLKKDEDSLKPLDLNDVKISLDSALIIAQEKLDEKNIKLITKKIIILQADPNAIWNLTFMTQSFDLVNIKINASSGAVEFFNSYSVFDLGLKQA